MDAIVDVPTQRQAACAADPRDGIAYVTYHVGVRTWKRARAVSDEAARAGWLGSYYVDPAHWVVRLVSTAAPTATFIEESNRFIERLASKHDGAVLAVMVEVPMREASWG